MLTNKKAIRLILIGIASIFLAFSMLFLSRAMAIIDYGEVGVPGIGCDSCLSARESLLMYSLIFGIIGGILGSIGIWASVKAMKEHRTSQTQA